MFMRPSAMNIKRIDEQLQLNEEISQIDGFHLDARTRKNLTLDSFPLFSRFLGIDSNVWLSPKTTLIRDAQKYSSINIQNEQSCSNFLIIQIDIYFVDKRLQKNTRIHNYQWLNPTWKFWRKFDCIFFPSSSDCLSYRSPKFALIWSKISFCSRLDQSISLSIDLR